MSAVHAHSAAGMARAFGLDPVHGHDGGPARIGAAIWSGAAQEIVAPPDPEIAVFALPLSTYRCAVFRDGRQVIDTVFGGDRAQIMPPGVTPKAVMFDPFRLIHVYVPKSMITTAADALGYHECELLDPTGASDRGYADLMRLIAETIRAGSPSALWMDSIGLTLTSCAVRRWSNLDGRPFRSARGGLAPWAERRCCEYIREHLAEDIALTDLAGIARLSPFHFARMFKASTGLPPHAWQRRCRVEKAQGLLATTELSVTQIALAVGYDTPQAFARMFRAEVGASPSEWRREVRA